MFDELFQAGGLSLERLQTLCLLGQARGITDAAGGDPTRQSQFSRQLAELEEFFGVELVNRRLRPRQLTTAGRELARIAQEALAALDDFRRRGLELPSRIVIGAGESVVQWLLLPKLDRLQAALPEITFVFKNLSTKAAVAALEDGTVDVVMARQGAVPDGMKTSARLTHGHLLAVPLGLLRGREPTRRTAGNLSALPLAVLEGSGDLRRNLERLAQEQGSALDVRLECSSFAQIALAIQTGRFAGVLPDFARSALSPTKSGSLVFESLAGLERMLVVAWNPAAAKLRPRIREAATQIGRLFRT